MQVSQQQRAIAALQTFLNTPLAPQLQQSARTDAQAVVLQFFHSVVATVPAYQVSIFFKFMNEG
jgi:hypothetical protein